MQVTVVIPTYNAQSTIAATIDSVRAQTYGNWELIVVDGGSDDHTCKIAYDYSQRDERIYTLEHRNCANAVDALNYGISERSRATKCVLVLDADDLLVKDALEGLIGVLIDNRQAVAAYGRFRIVDGAGQALQTAAADKFTDTRLAIDDCGCIAKLPAESSLTFNALVLRNCVKSTGQMLIRSDAVRRLGPFDPAAFPVDDWDMWIRLSLLGEIPMLDRVVLDYRARGDESVLEDGPIEPGEIYFRRKLVHTLGGDDHHLTAIAGWRLRERRLIYSRLRAAVKNGMAGRRREACSELLGYLRESVAYIYHWGLWRSDDRLPRHAGRRTVDSWKVARA